MFSYGGSLFKIINLTYGNSCQSSDKVSSVENKIGLQLKCRLIATNPKMPKWAGRGRKELKIACKGWQTRQNNGQEGTLYCQKYSLTHPNN